MIIWITGNSQSGKTTLARQMKTDKTVLLDGDDFRGVYPTGFSSKDRWEHNIRIAKIAKLIDKQGINVIVSFICPYKKLREEVREITNCSFIYLSGGKKHKDYPYEYEDKKYFKADSKICLLK